MGKDVCACVHARMQVKASEAEAELRQGAAEASALQLDTELGALRARMVHLEAAGKARDKDVERLQRAIDQCKAAEVRIAGCGRPASVHVDRPSIVP